MTYPTDFSLFEIGKRLYEDDIETISKTRFTYTNDRERKMVDELFILTIHVRNESPFFRCLFVEFLKDKSEFCWTNISLEYSIYEYYVVKVLKSFLADYNFILPLKNTKWCDSKRIELEASIYFWSIAACRPKLSYYFWKKRTEDRVLLCILSSCIMKASSLYAKQANNLNIMNKYESNSNVWEERAFAILSDSHKTNEDLTKAYLVGKNGKNDSILELLKVTKSLKLISSYPCQNLLQEMWTFPLDEETTNLSVISTIFFPIFGYFFIQQRTSFDTSENSLSYSEKHQNSMFISSYGNCSSFLKAPITKFWLYQISLLVYFILFVNVLLFHLPSDNSLRNLSVYEILLWIYSFSFILEELIKVR